MLKLPGRFAIASVILLLMVACGGSSSPGLELSEDPPIDEPDEVVETPDQVDTEREETPTDVPAETTAPESTSTPVPVAEEAPPAALSEAEMVSAAEAALASEPGDLLAWDIIGTEVFGDRVRLELCGWTGETVFSAVQIAEFKVVSGNDGTPDVQAIFDGNQPGECLNQELVNSALSFANAYDSYWTAVTADPTTFDSAEASQFMSTRYLPISEEFAVGWQDRGVQWRDRAPASSLPDGSSQDVLWRYSMGEDAPTFEIVACLEHGEDYGLYEGDVLVDDFKSASVFGTQLPHRVQLVRENNEWRFDGGANAPWSNCAVESWVDLVNEWTAAEESWKVLDSNA